MGAQAVYEPRRGAFEVPVPDIAIARRQWKPCEFVLSRRIEQAPFHTLRMAREHGQVHTVAVPMGTQGAWSPGAEDRSGDHAIRTVVEAWRLSRGRVMLHFGFRSEAALDPGQYRAAG